MLDHLVAQRSGALHAIFLVCAEVLLDPQNSVGGQFNGGELPTTVIIDAMAVCAVASSESGVWTSSRL